MCASIMAGSLERSVSVSLFTADASAQGCYKHSVICMPHLLTMLSFIESDDYSGLSTEVVYGPDIVRQCVQLALLEDDVLEIVETFQVQLTTDDVSVMLNPDVATVSILDSNG